jgi:hypothetical protein
MPAGHAMKNAQKVRRALVFTNVYTKDAVYKP